MGEGSEGLRRAGGLISDAARRRRIASPATLMTSRKNAGNAAGIRLFSSSSMRAALDELVPQFERASGCRVAASYDAANLILKRIGNGEAADVAILAGSAIDELTKQGKIAVGSRIDLARSGIGLAVRMGAPRPGIGSVEAFRRALLDAKSVAYTTAGASGVYFEGVIERLGIAAQVNAKARTRPAGLIGELVANGEAEIAIQQIPELMAVAGIELVGPLPPELHRYITLAAGVFSDTRQPETAQALLTFLSTPAAARAMKASGMEPV